MPQHAHPGVVLWMWATFFLDRDQFPQGRVLIRFDYPTCPGRVAELAAHRAGRRRDL